MWRINGALVPELPEIQCKQSINPHGGQEIVLDFAVTGENPPIFPVCLPVRSTQTGGSRVMELAPVICPLLYLGGQVFPQPPVRFQLFNDL